MANDRYIKLPSSLGPFVYEGTPENGEPVWFTLSLWGATYGKYTNSVWIRAKWSLQKKGPSRAPSWLPSFLRPKTRTIWYLSDGDSQSYLTGDYKNDIVSAALNSGIILDNVLMRRICGAADGEVAALCARIDDALRGGLKLAA